MILGCNGPYPDEYGATAGYAVNTTAGMIALDMGSGVFSRLKSLIAPEKISAVCLSHLHFDHMSDLGVFDYYLEVLTKHKGYTGGKMRCFVPPVPEVEELRRKYTYFEFIPVEENKIYVMGACKMRFYKLKHGAPNYGVKIVENVTHYTLAYSGDTNVCDNLYRLVEDCDLWLGSAPFIGSEYQPEGGHLSVEVMQEIAVRYDIDAMVTHLCPQHTVAEYRKACTYDRMFIAEPLRSYEV